MNCLLQAISPFPTVFSKDLYCRHVKTRACWDRVNSLLADNSEKRREFICLGFYAISTVYQLFNGDRSQIHVSWTIFNKYLTHSLLHHFQTVPKSRKLQTTTKIWLLKYFLRYRLQRKLLILSNFSFFHNVFLKLLSSVC